MGEQILPKSLNFYISPVGETITIGGVCTGEKTADVGEKTADVGELKDGIVWSPTTIGKRQAGYYRWSLHGGKNC